MAKHIFILTSFLFSLSGSTGEICLKSSSLKKITCNDKWQTQILRSEEPVFVAYKLVVTGSDQRRCRFSPTCSRFLIESIHRHGIYNGIKNGFARAQLSHDNQWDTINTMQINGYGFIFDDPVSNWDSK